MRISAKESLKALTTYFSGGGGRGPGGHAWSVNYVAISLPALMTLFYPV
jgi:hypothetical protein